MSFQRISSFSSNDSGYETATNQDTVAQVSFRQQDNTKEQARRRQQMMADELSQQASEEYQQDMLEHMLRMDQETMPDVDSIDIQTEIRWYMRPYLLDFLVEAHMAFQLLPETLFLTVNLLDRYCSKRVVYKRHYQLVGCAALLIASKYGDKKEKVPTIKELRSMCCALYDEDMFLQMEWHVLSTIGWTIGHPTVDAFLGMAIKDSAHHDPEVQNMALYILEIALFHRDFVSRRSSQLALAALALSRSLLSRPRAQAHEWAATYDHTTYNLLSERLGEASSILTRKYQSTRHSGVARTLTHILAQRAAAAAAAAAQAQAQAQATAHTYDLTPPSSKSNTYFSSYGTPQKPTIPSIVQHGLYTPPITPSGDEMFGVTQKTFGSGPSQYVPPTPGSNAPYQQQPHSYQQGHSHPASSRWAPVDA